MANDAMDQLMKAILKAEKQYGDNHQYRHVFGALREARYAASKVSSNANYESPGTIQAREQAGKAHVPDPVDSHHPTVPSTEAESGTTEGGSNGGPAGTT